MDGPSNPQGMAGPWRAETDKVRFPALRNTEENERVIQAGGRPATAQAMLLGITKASFSTDSFISASLGPGPPTRGLCALGWR